MNCPICGKHATLENNVKGISTAAGIGAGGYLAANSGAAGAAIGSMILPGLGTIAGGIIGILAGAAAGGSTGHVIGKLIDEDVIRNYRCDSCGYTWRAV